MTKELRVSSANLKEFSLNVKFLSFFSSIDAACMYLQELHMTSVPILVVSPLTPVLFYCSLLVTVGLLL